MYQVAVFAASTVSVQLPVTLNPSILCLQAIHRLQADNQSAQQRGKDAERRAAAMLEEKNRLAGKVSGLEQERQQLQEDKQHLQEDNKHLQEDNKHLQKDNKHLQEDKQHLQEDNKHLQEAVKDTASCVKVLVFSSSKSSCLCAIIQVTCLWC